MRLKIDTVGCETTYVCEDMDAGLPLHAHEPGAGLEHDVLCVSGGCVVFIHPREVRTLWPGMRFSFDSTRWHGIRPLVAGASFKNTTRLPQPDFHSVLEQGHNAPEWACRT